MKKPIFSQDFIINTGLKLPKLANAMQKLNECGQFCISCGEPATHECEESRQFVCGFWLCDNCEHDYSKEGYQHKRKNQ